jgi:hypothetical protein
VLPFLEKEEDQMIMRKKRVTVPKTRRSRPMPQGNKQCK